MSYATHKGNKNEVFFVVMIVGKLSLTPNTVSI